mgnify:CR=1 FL=1
MTSVKNLVLIDAHSIIYRAYHALPPLTAPDNTIINAVYGFSSIFIKIIQEKEPDFLVAAFDVAAPTLREKEFKEYKAQRQKMPSDLVLQIPLVKETLDCFGVPVYEKEGFEADDVIGAIVEQTKGRNDVKIIIVSGDLDILQLVNDKVEAYIPQKGVKEAVVFDKAKVFEKYSLQPYQITDLKGLKGDASDNIPGVPGVGEKTAIFLLKEFQNLENLYKNLGGADISSRIRALLLEYKEQAFLSKKLATIKKEAPIDFDLESCAWGGFNKEEIGKLFKKFGFESLIKRLS